MAEEDSEEFKPTLVQKYLAELYKRSNGTKVPEDYAMTAEEIAFCDEKVVSDDLSFIKDLYNYTRDPHGNASNSGKILMGGQVEKLYREAGKEMPTEEEIDSWKPASDSKGYEEELEEMKNSSSEKSSAGNQTPSEKTVAKDPDEEEISFSEGEKTALEGGEEKREWDDYRTAWDQSYSHRRKWDAKGEVGEHDVSDVKRPLNKGGYRLLKNQTIDGEEVLVAKTGALLQHKAVIHANGQVDFGRSTNKHSIHDAIEMKLRMGQDVVILSGNDKFRDAVEVELYKIANDKGLSADISERAQASLENIWKEKDKAIISKLHDDYIHGGPLKKARVLRELKGYGITGKDGKNITDEDMAAAGGVDKYFEGLAEKHSISKEKFYKKHPLLTGKTAEEENVLGSDERDDAADGKAADGKAADGKAADGKAADGKAADGKAADGKAADGKAADGKAADGKAADGKAADGKAADGKAAKAGGKYEGIPHGADDLKELANRYVYDLASDARGDDKRPRQLSEQEKQKLDNLITGKDGNKGDADKFREAVEMVIENTTGDEHTFAKKGLKDVEKRAKADEKQAKREARIAKKVANREKRDATFADIKKNLKGLVAAGKGAAAAVADFAAKGHSKESTRLGNLAKRIRGGREG